MKTFTIDMAGMLNAVEETKSCIDKLMPIVDECNDHLEKTETGLRIRVSLDETRKKINVGGIKINLYSSAKEMPVSNYHQLQLYGMQESGIGSTLDDVSRHHQALDDLLQQGRIEDAMSERQNLHLNYYSMIDRLDHKSLSFACMVKSIEVDGIEIDNDNLSEDQLRELTSKLSDAGLTREMVEDTLDEIKKNFKGN